ncbi:MAG: hypothetical protein HY737_02565 [Candidatus Omnitrophica bacterium]|nr:hypothetical protein [Candidatus Omnitrophota bacterium]
MKNRGFVLTFAMVAAILIAIVCMALLAMASNEAHRARFHRLRSQALYASEAGVTWAQEQLRLNGCWSPAGPLAVNGVSVVVTVSACPGVCTPPGPCPTPREISTRVAY